MILSAVILMVVALSASYYGVAVLACGVFGAGFGFKDRVWMCAGGGCLVAAALNVSDYVLEILKVVVA